jgi:hypothetical protein
VTLFNFVCKCRAALVSRLSAAIADQTCGEKFLSQRLRAQKFPRHAEVPMNCGFPPRRAARIDITCARSALRFACIIARA